MSEKEVSEVRVKVYKIGPEMENEKYCLLVNGNPVEFEPGRKLTPNFNLVDQAYRDATALPNTELVQVHGTDVSLRGAILKERFAMAEIALEDEDLFRYFLFAQGGLEELFFFSDGTWGDQDPNGEAIWTLKANDEHLRRARSSIYEHLRSEFQTQYNLHTGLE